MFRVPLWSGSGESSFPGLMGPHMAQRWKASSLAPLFIKALISSDQDPSTSYER